MATGSFPPCSPPSSKKTPFNQTAQEITQQLTVHFRLGLWESSALPGFQEHLGQSEGALRSNRFSVDLHIEPRKTPGQMQPKPQIS